ncbi:MAG: DNA glycosylase [Bacillota bacterium]
MAEVSVESVGDDVRFSGIAPFSLKDTLLCGQAFRWHPTAPDFSAFTGVVEGRVLSVRQEGESLILEGPADEDVVSMTRDYFALDVDLGDIREGSRRLTLLSRLPLILLPGYVFLSRTLGKPW